MVCFCLQYREGVQNCTGRLQGPEWGPLQGQTGQKHFGKHMMDYLQKKTWHCQVHSFPISVTVTVTVQTLTYQKLHESPNQSSSVINDSNQSDDPVTPRNQQLTFFNWLRNKTSIVSSENNLAQLCLHSQKKNTYVRKLAFDHFNSMQHKRLHRILSSRNVTCENCESARSLSPANCTTLDSCQEINLNHRRNICWGWLPVILLIPDYSVQNSSTFDIFKRVDLPRPPSQKLGTLYF